MNHKTAATAAIAAAAVIVVAGGLAFAAAEHISPGLGIYWAVTTATTAGHWIAVLLMLTAVPLVAATFSLVTAILTASRVKWHMNRQEERLRQHIEDQLQHHPGRSGE